MNHQWYIPTPRTHHDSSNAQKLVRILRELDIAVYCEPYIPFGNMDYDFLDKDKPVVLYGSLNVIQDYFRRKIKLHPFCWCDFNQLKCSSYYTYYGKNIIQDKYGFYPLREASRNKDFLYELFGIDDTLFIRPDSNDKIFDGELVYKESFDSWYRSCAIECEGQLTTLCMVSSPQVIKKEWRLFIKYGQVITGSQYKQDGKLLTEAGFPDIVGSSAEKIITEACWEPHPIYTMDIGLSNNEYKVIEIGSVNAAGMYESDIRKIAEAIIGITKEEWA